MSAGERLLLKKFRQTHRNMVYRCTNPNDKRYSYYSKVGVDPEWLDYDNFKADMYYDFFTHVGTHGLRNTTIDRIDNKLGYSKYNCKWSTWEEQRLNRSNTVYPVQKTCLNCECVVVVKPRVKMVFCNPDCKSIFYSYRAVRSREVRNEKRRMRYKNDPLFKRRKEEANLKWKLKNPEKVKSINKKASKRWIERKKEDLVFVAKQKEYRRQQWKKSVEKMKLEGTYEEYKAKARERLKRIYWSKKLYDHQTSI